jgi:hypothetical protein
MMPQESNRGSGDDEFVASVEIVAAELHLPPPPVVYATPEQRAALLSQTVATQVAAGWRVESQGPISAILVTGTPVNHVLQLLLTVFTCGLWAPIWLLLALTSRERRAQVAVDDFGNVYVQQLR